MFHKNNKGFTLIELLVVIAIIGILSTLAIISLSGARLKSRDAKRFADMKQLSTALELFYTDNGLYPTYVTPGLSIQSPNGSTTYMATIPKNPTPRADNLCTDHEYVYATNANNNDYQVYFCTGNVSGDNPSGPKLMTPSGIQPTGLSVGDHGLDTCGGFFGTGRCEGRKVCCSIKDHCYGKEYACSDKCGIIGIGGEEVLCPSQLGRDCTSNEDCQTGLCENDGGATKVCVEHTTGESCVGNFNCDSHLCQYGVCVVANFIQPVRLP